MPTDHIEELKEAIRKHRILIIQCTNDLDTRVIEPHTLGYNAKGNLILSSFQRTGYSSRSIPTGWKLFIVNDKSEVLFDQQYKYPAILSDNNFKDKYNRYEKYPFNIVNNLLSVIQESINGDNKELLEYKFIIENNQVIVKKLILGDQYQIFVER